MKKDELIITTPGQLEALVSPVRNQIHLLMESLGTSTVNELADRIGCSAESLYYHVGKLERVGIVVRTGQRANGSRPESVYRLAGQRIRIDPNQNSERFLNALSRGIRTLLRYAERCLVRALGRSSTQRGGPNRNFRIEQQIVKLNRRNLIELQKRFDDINEFLANVNDCSQNQSCVVTVVISLVDGIES